MSAEYYSLIEFTFSDNHRQLGFRFSDDITLGEHNISEFDDHSVFPKIWYMDGIHSYKPRSGSITIIELTPRTHIKGSFSFEMESYPNPGKIKSVTEGSFDITFAK